MSVGSTSDSQSAMYLDLHRSRAACPSREVCSQTFQHPLENDRTRESSTDTLAGRADLVTHPESLTGTDTDADTVTTAYSNCRISTLDRSDHIHRRPLLQKVHAQACS